MSRSRSLRPRPRTFLARQCVRLAERWMSRTLMPVDYPPLELGPRYGHGRPPHARLLGILSRGDEAYRRNLELIASYREDLLRIEPEPSLGRSPAWINRWLLGLDSAAIYSFVRDRAPASYLEVGSGMSTLLAHRAVTDGGLATRIVSIDPQPRDEVEAVCDHGIRCPLESADLAVFDSLRSGDVVFVDGSHRVLTNSDATVFFLDVLPELPAGVLVGVHDIVLPDDYPPEWAGHHWSEQYLMAAYLLAEGERIQLELACSYVTEYSDLHRILEPLWDELAIEELDRRGFALWFTTSGR